MRFRIVFVWSAMVALLGTTSCFVDTKGATVVCVLQNGAEISIGDVKLDQGSCAVCGTAFFTDGKRDGEIVSADKSMCESPAGGCDTTVSSTTAGAGGMMPSSSGSGGASGK